MGFSTKKILAITSISIFSFGLVWGTWAFSGRVSGDLYKTGEQALLKATSSIKPGEDKTLEDWEKTLIEREAPTLITRDVNYTQEIARQVTAEFLRARANVATEVDEEKLVERVLAQALPEKQEIDFREYKISDLKLTTDNSPEAFKNYGNSLGGIKASEEAGSTRTNEAEILLRAISSNRVEELKKLKPIAEKYENWVSLLLKIEVPTELASVHLNIANSISRVASSVEELSKLFEDPARGLLAIGAYSGYTIDLKDYLKELDKIMKDKEVVFGEKEPGILIDIVANGLVKKLP
jgi:hypothetical protein